MMQNLHIEGGGEGPWAAVPENKALEKMYIFYIKAKAEGYSEVQSGPHTLIVGCTADIAITKDPSFIRSMTILPNNTNNEKYSIVPPIITEPSYCRVFDLVLIDLEVNTNFWSSDIKQNVRKLYIETDGIVLGPKITPTQPGYEAFFTEHLPNMTYGFKVGFRVG